MKTPQKHCMVCYKLFQKPTTESKKSWEKRHKYCSRICAYRAPRSPETRQRQSVAKRGKPSWNKGRRLSPSHRESLRKKHRMTPEGIIALVRARKRTRPWNKIGRYGKRRNERPRKTMEYKQWRKRVFERDGYRCKKCGSKDNIQADHIKSFALYPELRTSLSNGRTLCISCHKKETKKFYRIVKSNKIAKNTNAA